MMQLKKVDPKTVTTEVASLNPATIMIAAALYSFEKQLDEIQETQKKILSFLEIENESQIEADVESLIEISTNYKYNWDNEISVSSSHQLVIDIKNRSRKNVIVFQKKVIDAIAEKKIIVTQNIVKSTLSDLEKKFKYYRLSLYTLSFASLMEIMLSGNFKEEFILKTKEEIKTMSDNYIQLFEKANLFIGKLGSSEVEVNVLKGIGGAGKSVGRFIGSIPLLKKGKADKFLQDKGKNCKRMLMK